MNSRTMKIILVFFLIQSMLIPVLQGQVVVYNNFGPGHGGWDYTYTTGWTIAGDSVSQQYGVEQAMLFDCDEGGTLTDIWIAISRVPSSFLPDTVVVRLTTNPSGQPPDTANILEEWTLTTFETWSQWNTPHHLAGSGDTWLEAGNSYWLWTVGTETTWCMWCMNEDPALTIPHTIRREGEDWLAIGNETAGAFRVDADPALGKEPTPAGLSGNALAQNYPNPFAERTGISFHLAEAGFAELNVYNRHGGHIQTLVNRYTEKGLHEINFLADGLPAGVYFYRLLLDGRLVDTKKMIHYNWGQISY